MNLHERFSQQLARCQRVLKIPHLGPCLEWRGSRFTFGYGRIKDDGRTLVAHRVAWENKHGPVPDGKCVLHSCDNPPCVDDAHLFLGTKTDNARDRDSKGRQATGDRITKNRRTAVGYRNGAYTHPEARRRGALNGRAKLSQEDVERIRIQHALGKTNIALGKEYGVSDAMVSYIVRYKNWATAIGRSAGGD